jgi:hypothetical protein
MFGPDQMLATITMVAGCEACEDVCHNNLGHALAFHRSKQESSIPGLLKAKTMISEAYFWLA